jgi:hypothetical protein
MPNLTSTDHSRKPCAEPWPTLILAQVLESVTLYHTIQHFSALFGIMPLTRSVIAHGG